MENDLKSVSMRMLACTAYMDSLFSKIPSEPMTFAGAFSDDMKTFSIGCYTMDDWIGAGKSLPELTVDWSTRTLKMPVEYYESIFIRQKYPSSTFVSKTVRMEQDVDAQNDHVVPSMGQRDQVVPDIFDLPDLSVEFSGFKDLGGMSGLSGVSGVFSDAMNNLSLGDIKPYVQNDSVSENMMDTMDTLQSKTQPEIHKNEIRKPVLNPMMAYTFQYKMEWESDGDDLLGVWNASRKELGCSMYEMISCWFAPDEFDVYVSPKGYQKFSRISMSDIEEYMEKRSIILTSDTSQ